MFVCFFLSEGKELKDDVISRETSSLTKAQAAAVKKRVDTLNATLRKKQKLKDKQKADVRDLFTPSQVSIKLFSKVKTSNYWRSLFSLVCHFVDLPMWQIWLLLNQCSPKDLYSNGYLSLRITSKSKNYACNNPAAIIYKITDHQFLFSLTDLPTDQPELAS